MDTNLAFITGTSPWLANQIPGKVTARRPRTCVHKPQLRKNFVIVSKRGLSNPPDDSPYKDSNGVESQNSDEMLFSTITDYTSSNNSNSGSSKVNLDENGESASEVTEQSSSDAMSEGADQVCLGEFLYSPSLNEYREQKEAGLLSSAIDSSSEFSDAWALSVSAKKAEELKNQYSRVGIFVKHNFDDFESAEGCNDAYANASLEEIASTKARMVYESTGLPAIAETHDLYIDAPESGSRVNKSLQQGYYTRNVAENGDAMIDRVRPVSDENRMTRFSSAAAYYDGEMHFVTRKEARVAIIFSGAHYCTIAITAATDDLYKTLTYRLGLTLDDPLKRGGLDPDDEGEEGKPLVGATLLKERILREGKVLNDNILKVSSFMNHMVDTDLMEACGEELAERLRHTMPNKVLTVESTGLIAGLPTARKLGIPLVFARKSRPITISDSYQTTYRSATKGTTNELIVSCEYLESDDRVLIIDDFLAGGSTAEALFKLAKMAHAKIVGVGVLIEKMTDGGRAFLSGYDVPVESLAKIQTGNDKGSIQFIEEEVMNKSDAKKRRESSKEAMIKAQTEYYSNGMDDDDNDNDNDSDEEKDYIDEDTVDIIRWEDEEIYDDLEENLIRENGR